MSYVIENPHFLPGSISGLGMERTQNGRVVDTRYAVHLDCIDACLIEHPEPGHPMYALALGGRIGGDDDRARCVFLVSPDAAGVLMDRIINLAGMINPDFTERLTSKVRKLRPAPEPEEAEEIEREQDEPGPVDEVDQKVA